MRHFTIPVTAGDGGSSLRMPSALSVVDGPSQTDGTAAAGAVPKGPPGRSKQHRGSRATERGGRADNAAPRLVTDTVNGGHSYQAGHAHPELPGALVDVE
ncbi:hypothetical protein [Streptomyces sp. NPDC004135]